MATFTITTAQNIENLTGKTGGDIYNINGGTLTIDQHSRFGLNNANTSATAATSMGTITLSATLGGTLNIDGRYIRLIPFTGGSGTIPALSTVISKGSASGRLVCVYSSLTAAPLVNGATMPATGWVMIKQWNGVEYTVGTLTGLTATASGASVVGFLEIMGDESATINANRLGRCTIQGAWYALGTTNATANQQFQIPNHGTLRHVAGIFIEKSVGSADYEFYPNAGTVTEMGTEYTRGRVCWISNTGLVRIGHNGTANAGYVPVTGLKVVVPNIFLCNCTTAARNAVVIPNSTPATRYDFTTTGGGVVSIDKANMEWYPSFAQAFSVQMSNTGIIDACLISELASPLTWTKVGVGNKPTTALLTNPLTMSLCFAGGTFTDCVWTRVSQSASGAHTITLTDIYGFTFVNDTIRANTVRANATTYAINATRISYCTWTNPTIIQGSVTLTTCDNVIMTDTVYCESVSATTTASYAGYVWLIASNTNTCTFSGLSFPVTNTHPYTAILGVNAAGCSNIKMRNIGTLAAPLSMGSANQVRSLYTFATGAAAKNIKFQRIYTSLPGLSTMTADNSTSDVTEENVHTGYTSTSIQSILNYKRKSSGSTMMFNAQTAIYGTHWMSYFISTTVGRILIMMNEPTIATAPYVTLANGAAFTSAGQLYMPTIGMSATFEMDFYALGMTRFADVVLSMNGGTSTKYDYQYRIDKNDGAGFGAWSAVLNPTTLGTALYNEGALDPAKGVKLILKIITNTTNTDVFSEVHVTCETSTEAQGYQYPLDTNTITFTGISTGSDVVVLSAGTNTILSQQDSISGTTFSFTYSGAQNVDIGFIKQGYVPLYIRNLSLGVTDTSVPIAQTFDRNFA